MLVLGCGDSPGVAEATGDEVDEVDEMVLTESFNYSGPSTAVVVYGGAISPETHEYTGEIYYAELE